MHVKYDIILYFLFILTTNKLAAEKKIEFDFLSVSQVQFLKSSLSR